MLFILSIMQYESEIYRKPFHKDLLVVQGMIVLHIDSSCFPPMALENKWRLCWWLTPGGLKHIPVASPSIILGLVHSLCLYKSLRHQLLFLCILSVLSMEANQFLASLLVRVLTISRKTFIKESRINNNFCSSCSYHEPSLPSLPFISSLSGTFYQ